MRVLAAALGIGLAGLILMLFLASKNVVLFIIGIGSVGISFGSLLGLFPSITADYFGARNNSVNYGFMFIGIASAGLLGPAIMRTFLASTGSYWPSFIAAGALTVLGLLIHLLCLRFIHARVAKENNMEFNK
jgi:MFS family permease